MYRTSRDANSNEGKKFMHFLKQLFQTHSQWEASGKFFIVVLVFLNGVFNGFCLSREFCN